MLSHNVETELADNLWSSPAAVRSCRIGSLAEGWSSVPAQTTAVFCLSSCTSSSRCLLLSFPPGTQYSPFSSFAPSSWLIQVISSFSFPQLLHLQPFLPTILCFLQLKHIVKNTYWSASAEGFLYATVRSQVAWSGRMLLEPMLYSVQLFLHCGCCDVGKGWTVTCE